MLYRCLTKHVILTLRSEAQMDIGNKVMAQLDFKIQAPLMTIVWNEIKDCVARSVDTIC